MWKRLLVGTLSALLLAFIAAYFVVISQNPGAVAGKQVVYGSPAPQ